MIEIIFGTLITIIFSVMLVLFWFTVAIVPGCLARGLSKIIKGRSLLIIVGIVWTAIYYIYFPWGIFNAPYGSQLYKEEYISRAATSGFDIDYLNKTKISFLYYQPKIIISSDRLFAYHRLVKALEPRKDGIVMQMLQAIFFIADAVTFGIFFLVYGILGRLIAILLILWAPSLSFTIGCFKR